MQAQFRLRKNFQKSIGTLFINYYMSYHRSTTFKIILQIVLEICNDIGSANTMLSKVTQFEIYQPDTKLSLI